MLPLLEEIEAYLQQEVAPLAITLDHDPQVLRTTLQRFGDRGWLALRVPEIWQGLAISETTFRYVQELIARYSGALAFLQAQHQSAASMLCHSHNSQLQQTYLPRMSNGQALVGVGFSHLRRRKNSPVQALPIVGGYQVQGTVPWVTGFGCFQTFIVAATLPDQQAVYGLVPFTHTVQAQGGSIAFSPPMQLAALTATNTVTAQFNNWFLAHDQVVFIKPIAAIEQADYLNVLHHSFFAIGCARAGLDIIQSTANQKPFIFIQAAYEQLHQEWQTCRSAIFAATSQPYETKLKLRAWAIELAVRCAHAAVTVSSGAANDFHHAAQRIYREALVFTVTGQTTDVMEATLTRLVRQPTY
ncbi:acyl-CoA dehydrogenase family protein [Pantanalinema sp. GBBB05]|uniref:acyl-CoA dehydrogenase family protein n=1 Tax=Pantanalinema sp. GBBB05 TaxID=2604139 RepID=UPI001D8FDD93|nr:acyl-CoA dehydrogenase [Pantanalinema sp. GBBB05]